MPNEMRALTEELHAVNVMLGLVVDRLDASDRRASRHRLGSWLLAVALLVTLGLGAFFVVDGRNEDRRICQAVRGSAEALIAVTERPSDGEPRTPEQQERRDRLVAEYRALVARGCPA